MGKILGSIGPFKGAFMKGTLNFLFILFFVLGIFVNAMAFAFVLSNGNGYCDNPTKIQYLIPVMPLACWSLEPIEK